MARNFSDSQKQLLVQQLRTVLMQTELSGNTNYLYKFSQAGGQSTYSFGLLQFDLGKNSKTPTEAEIFLKGELGFTSSEITALKGSSIPASTLAEFNQRLTSNQDKIDAFTDKALAKDVNKLDNLISEVAQTRTDVAASILNNPHLQLRLLDYQNQFGLSGIDDGRVQADGFMMSYLKGNSVKMVGAPIQLSADGGLTEADLQIFRGHTLQADTNKRDAERREESLLTAFNSIDSELPSGELVNADHPRGTSSSPSVGGTGHWESPTQFDEMGNVIQSSAPVWVSDTPSTSATIGAGAGRGQVNPALAGAAAEQTLAQPTVPSTPQIAPDGTSATLPNGQVIYAGTGGTLDMDDDGNLIVNRPAQGWSNLDGSPSDIRQITTYDAKGVQIGTAIAQNLPGEAAPVENYAQRTLQVTQADGSTVGVTTHFQAGVGWVDDAGQTVRSLSDAPAPAFGPQTTPNPSSANLPADSPADFHAALLNAFSQPQAAINSGTDMALSMHDMERIASDAGLPDYGLFKPGALQAQAMQQLTQAMGDSVVVATAEATAAVTALVQPATLNLATDSAGHTSLDLYLGQTRVASVPSPVQEKGLIQINAGLSMVQTVGGLQHWSQMADTARFGSVVGLAGSYNTLSGGTLGDLSKLDATSSALSLLQAAQDGNTAGIVAGINAISDKAIDGAISSALGATGSTIPYVSVALALNDFDRHVGSSVGTLVGTFFAGSIGGAIGGMIGGALDGLFGGHSAPPPPEGAVHFSWDASGNIQHTIDLDERDGGNSAQQVAANVQSLLEQVVQAANARNTDPNQDLAINPYLLPRFGVSQGATWMEVTQSDGSILREGLGHEGFTEHLITLMQDNGALAPAWQVATIQGHWVQAQAELAELRAQRSDAEQSESPQAAHVQQQIDTRQQALDQELTAGKGGRAYAGNEAYSLQGNATERADFKTQDFGVLVVHISQHEGVQASLQALGQTLGQVQQALHLSEIRRDVENDGYAERTDWVAATDSTGKLQGLLVLDHNGNGLVETRDILNLGGNTAQAGNPTTEAELASRNAALQNNNVQWLDANGDGVLDARDPAFAAIKLWVDINQDGQMQASENASLADMGLQSINFETGEVVYADGQRDALSAATLHADTDGVRMTQITEVNPDGTLNVLDAGQVLEHEGYQGQVQITDDGGTRWGRVRDQTFEQEAKRIGDWEGTTEPEAHRHYGQRAEGAAIETTATGATSLGPVKVMPNAISESTISEGDSRVTSDPSADTSAPPQSKAQTVIAAGDIRIKSDSPAAPLAGASSAVSQRLAFVPSTQQSGQSEIRIVTNAMMQNAQDTLFGPGLGMLAAVGLGATAGAAEATLVVQRPALRLDSPALEVVTRPPLASTTVDFVSLDKPSPMASAKPKFVQAIVQSAATFPEIANEFVLPTSAVIAAAPLLLGAASLPSTRVPSAPVVMAATVVSASIDIVAEAQTVATPSIDTVAAPLSASNPLVFLPPVLEEQTLATAEDMTLRLGPTELLARAKLPNAIANPDLPALYITAVAEATHGIAQLVGGEVFFVPDADYHGTASFSYTATDQYGLSSTTTALIQIAAVNDTPVAFGESVVTNEDVGLVFTAASLLANESDVDTFTDGQALAISAVFAAMNGSVRLEADGNVRFLPDANYHGAASFSYTVSDGNNGTASANVNISVAAVNDVPVAVGESTSTLEDMVLTIDAATLLANDGDVDTATDDQTLSISAVSNASHGTVRLVTQADGRQQVVFTPDTNFHSQASFQYTVSDSNGATAIAISLIDYEAVNDAPVTAGELAQAHEDQRLVFAASELLANDSDVDTATDAQTLSINRVDDAVHGTVRMDSTGNIYFTPEANYHGAASFSYWVSDGMTETLATVRLGIAPVNDLPVAQGESLNSDEDMLLLLDPGSLLANDRDADTATDGQTLNISALGSSSHCSVAFVALADGSQRIVFTPEVDYFGVASFQYTVSDGEGGSTIAAMVVNLAQVNDVPIACDDSFVAIDEDVALHVSFSTLLANDSDADSTNAAWGGTDDVLILVSVGEANHGTVTLTATDVLFTPDANYHGPASFAYQVRDSSGAVAQAYASFTVLPVNDAPESLGETISTNEDTILVIQAASLLANDSDADAATDGQVLRISAVGGAMHGSVSLDEDGNIVFVPEANYFGAASFVYTVSDRNGGFSSAMATVVLAAVNDAPLGLGETIQSLEDQVLRIDAAALLANDGDVDNVHVDLQISRVQSGTGGAAYPDATGQVVFTPTANFNGSATFIYWVRDMEGLESQALTATVEVAAVNDAPTAQGEIVSGALEDTLFRIPKATLLANDHDVDDADSALRLSWVGSASGGTASLDRNGDVVFTPNANFNGYASFQYRVRDVAGLESAAVTAIVPLTAVNDAPTAVDDRFATYRNSTMSIGFAELTGNDSDIEGDGLTVSAVRDHANGHASFVNGHVQFVPTAGFSGAASFDYLTDDGHGGKTWATAFVDVKIPPNLYPTIDTPSLSVSPSWNSPAYVELWSLSVGFHITDEDPMSVSMSLVSATAYIQQGAGYPVQHTNTAFTRMGDGGSILFSASYTWSNSTWSQWFNELRSTWVLRDGNGVENVWHFDFHDDGYPGHWHIDAYAEHSGYYTSPVLVDLNGDGVHFNALQDSHVAIDGTHDGIADKMAWADNDDGVLVWDKDHNQQISDVSEFSFQNLRPNAQTDLEGLQALDTNHNGLLDKGDEKFAEFAVWQDANSNGVADTGEFLSLQERGIASITLHSDGQMRDAGTLLQGSLTGETDAIVMGNAAFTRTDGGTGVVADAMLAYAPGQASTAADLARQAALFNQCCNANPTVDPSPLGFFPLEHSLQFIDPHEVAQDSAYQALRAA